MTTILMEKPTENRPKEKTNNDIRKIIIKKILSKDNSKENQEITNIHPNYFIELFDRELNCGLYILRNDSIKILNKNNNGFWLIRRASIIGNKKMFPFVISYKYFNIYNYKNNILNNKISNTKYQILNTKYLDK